MRDRSKKSLPPDIAAAQSKFEDWRRVRTGRERIPEALWLEAAEVARQHGAWPAARALRLDYVKLKQRAGAGAKEPEASAAYRGFVEVLPPGGGVSGCIVEMENGRGGRMRIECRGAAADLAALSQAFWRAGA